MSSKIIDLDIEDVLIVVTHGDMKYALDRSKVIELLEKKVGSTSGKRSLASVGKAVSGFAGKKTLSETDCKQIIEALAAFDGRVPPGTTSQLGHHLRAVSATRGASKELALAVNAFLAENRSLETVARRGAKGKSNS